MQLTCPKCQAAMRQYERNGVNVDQCSECRGIFLDRGELERLIDAENDWHSASQQNPQQTPQQPAYQAPLPYPNQQQYQQGYGHQQGHGYHKKRKSFLENLFD